MPDQQHPSPIVLYGLERSVYTRIARLALEEKALPYTLEEVEIFGARGVPQTHLARHPFGRIPVLSHGTFSLFETSAITRYVDEAFNGPPLQPADVRLRARMNQVIGLLDAYAYRPMVWGVFVQRVRVPLQGGTVDEEEIARSLVTCKTCLEVLDDFLRDEPHLAGPSLSLADLHAFPMLCYFVLAPEGLALLGQHPHLLRWYQDMCSRASVLSTQTRYETASTPR